MRHQGFLESKECARPVRGSKKRLASPAWNALCDGSECRGNPRARGVGVVEFH